MVKDNQNSRKAATSAKKRTAKRNGKPKLGHDSVFEKLLSEIRPSPENDRIYKPVDPCDPEIVALAQSVREHRVKEPLVITLDDYILSGHRRFTAAKLAGLRKVPCRTEPIRREDNIDKFMTLLREYNRQREKSLAEKLREEVISADPRESYRRLTEYREEKAIVKADAFQIVGHKKRCRISKAKQPFLNAVLYFINSRRRFWPLSDRTIHYGLLNDPPLKHASKPDSRYDNTKQSYKSLVDLLTRARLEGSIPMNAIHDPTRPVTIWSVFDDPNVFIWKELDDFLKGYYRNLMQSQTNHIEIIGEKSTIEPILRPIASEYTIPLTTGRGYCSLPPRHAMSQRYRQSGKDKLILLMVSDFDPDGEEIAQSFARSMRDDFGIDDIHPIKVAITGGQVADYELPPVMTAKESSVHYDKFVGEHGHDVYEVEALDPDDLQQILRDAIDSVIDLDAFNAEVEAEANDAAFLDGVRETVHDALSDVDWDDYE